MAKMNKIEKERDAAWALAEMEKAPFVTVAFAGDEPYAVPVSHAFIGERLYFHSAAVGKKAEYMAKDPRVCVSAVSYSEPHLTVRTMRYRSAIASGRATLLPEGEEKVAALMAICLRYNPDDPGMKQCSEKPNAHMHVYRIDFDDVTGKCSYSE